jgi:lysozyme
MMSRDVSAEGRALIQQFEGLSLAAYLCPAGKWTIGYGHTDGVKPGDRITALHADSLLAADLAVFSRSVETCIAGAPTSQHEFDAMVSLAFNVGLGGFAGSTVLRLHKAGDTAGAANAFGLWRKITDPRNGKLVDSAGLMARRARETAFYLTPDDLTSGAPVVKAMPQAVAPEKSAVASKTVIAGGVTVAAGLGSVADQIDQMQPVIHSIAATGASLQNLLKLGGTALSVVAVVAGAYMLWRYLQKKRRGEVLSV